MTSDKVPLLFSVGVRRKQEGDRHRCRNQDMIALVRECSVKAVLPIQRRMQKYLAVVWGDKVVVGAAGIDRVE